MTNGGAPGGGPSLRILDDLESAAAAAAEAIADALGDAIAERGRADWATTGGSAAVPIYRALTVEPLHDAITWERVHLWWGDDRYVPADHPLSNVLPAAEVLLPEVAIPAAQVHAIPTAEAIGGALGPAWCASRYVTTLQEEGPATDADGLPVLDVIVLGVGPDGHVLSVFPGSPVWDSSELAAGVAAPTHIEPHVERVTLHPSLVAAARRVIVVATGASKAEALERAWSPGSERDVPARIAVRAGAVWFVDQAAAARLRR